MQVPRRKYQSPTTRDRKFKQVATNVETEADTAWSSTKETETKEHRGFESGLQRYQETNQSYKVQISSFTCLCLLTIIFPYFILSLVFREVLQPNKENCNPNVNIAKQLKPLVSSKIAEELILEKKFKVVQRQVVERFVSQNPISVEGIQSAMDETGISHNGYGFLQKKVISSFKSRGLKQKLLTTPATAIWRHCLETQEIS